MRKHEGFKRGKQVQWNYGNVSEHLTGDGMEKDQQLVTKQTRFCCHKERKHE